MADVARTASQPRFVQLAHPGPWANVVFPLPSYLQLEQDEASETDIESPTRTAAASIRSRTRIRPTDTVGLTFLNGLALVLGLQIGSGIFLAPAQVSRQVVSPALGVLVW